MSNFRLFPSLADLDSIFELRTETDPSANPTKLYYPAGLDLCLRYKVYSGGTKAARTKYNVIQSDGTFKDLNDIFAIPKGMTWLAMGPGIRGGVVLAISAVDNSNVYVGGQFTSASGVANTRGIARWDGAAWRAMGSGTNGNAWTTFAKDNLNVYVGGDFTSIGGDTNKKYIARWDGITWQRMGAGTDVATVRAISAVDNSNVYVGGIFTNALNAGGISVANTSKIAKWDGETWRAMGTGGADSSVFAISAVDNSNVYAGGQFTTIGGVSANRLARWDGATWQPMGTGSTNGDVIAMSAVDNSNVYAGGAFTTICGVNANRVARWDGANWQAMGTGPSATVNSIFAKDTSNVYVGGQFETASGVGVTYIARWDGANWRTMGTGNKPSPVYAISALDNLNVYAGGNFTTASGVGASYIARWTNNY
jgi:hypothetical protein